MIDPRLRTLQLVAHHGSVSAAARALHFTSSAVSQQLRGLSDDLGVTLVLQVVEAEPARCIDLLLAGDCALALLVVDDRVPPETDQRFEQHTVLDDPIDLAVPVGHHLTTQPEVTL